MIYLTNFDLKFIELRGQTINRHDEINGLISYFLEPKPQKSTPSKAPPKKRGRPAGSPKKGAAKAHEHEAADEIDAGSE